MIHKPGTIDDATLHRFVETMTTIHLQARGRVMLTFWRLSNFSRVPDEYFPMLEAILQEYPEPVHPPAFFGKPTPPVVLDQK
jgi:hypothetical protein